MRISPRSQKLPAVSARARVNVADKVALRDRARDALRASPAGRTRIPTPSLKTANQKAGRTGADNPGQNGPGLRAHGAAAAAREQPSRARSF